MLKLCQTRPRLVLRITGRGKIGCFTEHSEASRKGTKGTWPRNVVNLQRHVEVVGDAFVDLNVTLCRAIDFEILMSLPEDNGR